MFFLLKSFKINFKILVFIFYNFRILSRMLKFVGFLRVLVYVINVVFIVYSEWGCYRELVY